VEEERMKKKVVEKEKDTRIIKGGDGVSRF